MQNMSHSHYSLVLVSWPRLQEFMTAKTKCYWTTKHSTCSHLPSLALLASCSLRAELLCFPHLKNFSLLTARTHSNTALLLTVVPGLILKIPISVQIRQWKFGIMLLPRRWTWGNNNIHNKSDANTSNKAASKTTTAKSIKQQDRIVINKRCKRLSNELMVFLQAQRFDW